MKYFFCDLYVLFFNSSVFTEKTTTHKVERGESVRLRKSIMLLHYDIFQLNPDAQSGLKPIVFCWFKTKATKVVVQRSQLQKITHVAPKRLYMVLKKNTVSDDIKKSKSILEEGCKWANIYSDKIGQENFKFSTKSSCFSWSFTKRN
jgi:hypothetical protein